jgi:hypothetical protein
MTLNTEVVAITPCDAHDVFHECRRLLGATDAHPFNDEDRGAKTYATRDGDERQIYPEDDGVWEIGNQIGIGLPALMWVEYRPGLEPRRTPEEHHRCEDYCDPDCDRKYHDPACWVEIHFDTAYGYRGANGEGCGDLHARLLFDLGQWFDERKIGWGWENEFTGEWHYEDKYKALKELVSGGGQAMTWFVETVQPLIESAAVKL